MKNHRFLTLAGAGSAAALVAIGVMLFVPTPRSTVQAATIFASFREAVGNAFEISFENVGDDGIRANGRVVVVYDAAEDGDAPFESTAQAVYVEATAVAGEGAEDDVAGLDVEVAVAIVPGDEWVYLKLNGLPTEVVEEEPMAVWVQSIAQDGILLDLDGIMEKTELKEILEEVSIKKHFPDFEEGDHRIEISVGDDGEPEIDEEQLAQIAVGLFTGQATAEEFKSLVSLIEQAATNVEVNETEEGLYVLSASGFDTGEGEDWPIDKMLLQIAYREGSGVAWATLDHVGPYDGTVRFEITDMSPDDELFSRERYTADGKTRRFNLSSLIDTLQLLED